MKWLAMLSLFCGLCLSAHMGSADDTVVHTPTVLEALKGEWELEPLRPGRKPRRFWFDGSRGGTWDESEERVSLTVTIYLEGTELLLQHYHDPKARGNFRLKQLRYKYTIEGDSLVLNRGGKTEKWSRVRRLPDDPIPDPWNLPLSQSADDDHPPFQIDRKQAFRIELGRGGFPHGFDTVKVSHTGHVVLHRLKDVPGPNAIQSIVEKATLELSPASIGALLDSLEANKVLALKKKYAADAYDGMHWILLITQGKNRKVVYCDNHFPQDLVRFVAVLDESLADSGLENITWRFVPEAERWQHDRVLRELVR